MSRWKEKTIQIIQIIPNISAGYEASYTTIESTVGLGSDSMLYIWDYKTGKWEKGWQDKDE